MVDYFKLSFLQRRDEKNKSGLILMGHERNLFYDLPQELIHLIYEYDSTYNLKYKRVMSELKSVHYNLRKSCKEFFPSRMICRRVTSFC